MSELSPAAQAVRDAVLATYADNIAKDDNLWALERASTVAALRAAADQVVPVPINAKTPEEHWDLLGVKNRLLAIADELKG